MNTLSAAVAIVALACWAGSAWAKLPPPSDEAKAKAAEAAAKTAHSGKVAAYQLCNAMDRVAAQYRQTAKQQGKDVPAAQDTSPCAEPGPFVYSPTPVEPRPLETAGAHSPAKTVTAPPNTTTATSGQVDAKK